MSGSKPAIAPLVRQTLEGKIARYRQRPDGEAQVQRLLDAYRRRMYGHLGLYQRTQRGEAATTRHAVSGYRRIGVSAYGASLHIGISFLGKLKDRPGWVAFWL